MIRELSGIVINRGPRLCNFVEWKGFKVVYRRLVDIYDWEKWEIRIYDGYLNYNHCFRYAGLYFCMCIDQKDNELEVLDIIHHYVEILDRYFGSVNI